jgi:hypothetical protein
LLSPSADVVMIVSTQFFRVSSRYYHIFIRFSICSFILTKLAF